MVTKKTKRKEVKPINIDADIHKMLKMQATMEDKNMVEIVESAILKNIPDEILKMFKKSKGVRKKETSKKNDDEVINVKSSNEDKTIKNKESKVEKIEEKTVENEETAITSDETDNIELDDETSCYL